MEEMLLEEDLSLAEPEHLETMMDALIETVDQQVAGTECLGLTDSQQYAMSVLRSSGSVNRIAQVTGNEGFFSTIGDGVKKIWEYIQKMFNAIWNWFFGKKDNGLSSITEETDALIKRSQDTLKNAAANHAKFQLDIAPKLINTIEELDTFMTSPDATPAEKKEAQELKEELTEVKSEPPAQQAAVVAKVAEKLVKLNRRTQRALREACEQALAQHKQYYAVAEVDHSDKFKGTIFESDYGHYLQWLKEGKQRPLDAYIMIPTTIDGLSHAVRAQESLLKAVKALEDEKSQISATFKASVIHRIKDLEEKLTRKDLRDTTRDKWGKDLSACKFFLSMTTKAIKQIEETCRAIQRINKMIMRLFGMKVPHK